MLYNSRHIKPINKPKQGKVVHYYIDDSGTYKYKEMLNLDKEMNAGKMPSNGLKAFAITAVAITEPQYSKLKRNINSLKSWYGINHKENFHRHNMIPGKSHGPFKNISSSDMFKLHKNINRMIFQRKIKIVSAGIPNYKNLYLHGTGMYENDKQTKRILFKKFLKEISIHANKYYPEKQVILVFESEVSEDLSSYKIAYALINQMGLENIRQVRFMKKKNKRGVVNHGVELADYINTSSFSYFGMMDVQLHKHLVDETTSSNLFEIELEK